MADETENKLNGRTKNKVAVWWMYLLIGFVALIVFASMGYIFYIGNQMAAIHTPLKDAAMEIKMEVSIAHLYFKEIISGDSYINIDEVLEHIDQADWYAKAMLEGGQNTEGKFYPLSDPHMRQEITTVRRELAEFREITLQQWQTSKTAGIGTEIDQKYDEIFKDVLQQTDLVETDLEQMIAGDYESFQIVQMVLIAICLAITVVVGIAFSRFLKNQIRHELELQAANLQFEAGNQQLMASEKQLKAANQQLAASEKEARILAKFPSENPNPVLRISKDNAILYSNKTAEPILAAWGCEENTCICLPDREKKKMMAALSSGEATTFDMDHGNRSFSITLAPVPESGYVNIYAYDITDCKRAQEQLRKERDKAQKYLDVAEVMLLVIDVDCKVRLINQKGCKILDYNENEIIGKNWFDKFLPKRMRKDVKDVFKKIMVEEMGPFEYFENPVLNKDGDERLIAWHNTILRDEQGCIIGVLSSGEDITKRKKYQEQLLGHQEKLKSLASQLSVIEERERYRLATELHDQIGQSLVMSKMKLDSLRQSMSSGEYTDVLREVCDCLGDVIRETRTLTFELSSPILYELGFETAVTEWLDEQIRKKHGIQTEFRDDGQPKPLDNDIRALLFRNVRELLINIIKHAKARKVKVSVRKVNEQICVIIEDDGVGFEPAKIGSNTGFGIFSIRERLEQLDGHLEIESEPGRGSRITMTAPLKVEKSTEGVDV
jgi:PAS domain S-box-containing protein